MEGARERRREREGEEERAAREIEAEREEEAEEEEEEVAKYSVQSVFDSVEVVEEDIVSFLYALLMLCSCNVSNSL